eukprot:TRINITY_DN8849_c0_g1_i1.p1 TRINITY_DN8849_c0_g1~~TRINITY_DN8849_c0_g1_i1.p1  ORF type:complete len:283 (-),score=54.86 TRINITY_DN8849_c0_g1_i1:602-1450(-)
MLSIASGLKGLKEGRLFTPYFKSYNSKTPSFTLSLGSQYGFNVNKLAIRGISGNAWEKQKLEKMKERTAERRKDTVNKKIVELEKKNPIVVPKVRVNAPPSLEDYKKSTLIYTHNYSKFLAKGIWYLGVFEAIVFIWVAPGLATFPLGYDGINPIPPTSLLDNWILVASAFLPCVVTCLGGYLFSNNLVISLKMTPLKDWCYMEYFNPFAITQYGVMKTKDLKDSAKIRTLFSQKAMRVDPSDYGFEMAEPNFRPIKEKQIFRFDSSGKLHDEGAYNEYIRK